MELRSISSRSSAELLDVAAPLGCAKSLHGKKVFCLGWQKSFAARFLLLIPIAFCLFVILDSQDKNIRLAAVIGLAIIAQVREWLLVSSMRALAKGNKH